MTNQNARMRQLSDDAASWSSVNPILLKGEMGYDNTNNEIRVGDGVKDWKSLPPIGSQTDWAKITGKPSVFPTSWNNVAGKPSAYKPDVNDPDLLNLILYRGDYSQIDSYKPGDVVYYGDVLYRNVQTASGPWDPTRWEAVSFVPPDASIPSVLTNDGLGGINWRGFVDKSTGIVDGSKIPMLDASGKLDTSLFPSSLAGALHYVGTHAPTLSQEYPAGQASQGDTYVIIGPDYTFTTGDLAGKTGRVSDLIIYDGSKWSHVDQHVVISSTGGITMAEADSRFLKLAGGTLQANAMIKWPTNSATPGSVIIDGGDPANAYINNVTLDMGTY